MSTFEDELHFSYYAAKKFQPGEILEALRAAYALLGRGGADFAPYAFHEKSAAAEEPISIEALESIQELGKAPKYVGIRLPVGSVVVGKGKKALYLFVSTPTSDEMEKSIRLALETKLRLSPRTGTCWYCGKGLFLHEESQRVTMKKYEEKMSIYVGRCHRCKKLVPALNAAAFLPFVLPLILFSIPLAIFRENLPLGWLSLDWSDPSTPWWPGLLAGSVLGVLAFPIVYFVKNKLGLKMLGFGDSPACKELTAEGWHTS
jgi:hypothetical protein